MPRRQAVIWKPGEPVPRGSRSRGESQKQRKREEVLFAVKSDRGVRTAGLVVADIQCPVNDEIYEREDREGMYG
jgi:hypothetical protein